MSDRRRDRGKGKAVVIDLTFDEPVPSTFYNAEPVQSTLPATPRRNTRPTSPMNESTFTQPVPSTPTRAGPSNTAPPNPTTPTPGSKRTRSQARITAYFPPKKFRVDPIPFQLTKEEAKEARDKQKMKEEENRVARADAIRLAKALEKEERAQKKAERERLREAEKAHKQQQNQWKADWKSWVERHRQPDARLKLPKRIPWDIYVNATGTEDYGLTQRERQCLPHCDLKNPHEQPGQEYAPMKIYRRADVELLAWRKEGVLTGVSQDDEEALLEEGERRYKARKGEKQDDKVK